MISEFTVIRIVIKIKSISFQVRLYGTYLDWSTMHFRFLQRYHTDVVRMKDGSKVILYREYFLCRHLFQRRRYRNYVDSTTYGNFVVDNRLHWFEPLRVVGLNSSFVCMRFGLVVDWTYFYVNSVDTIRYTISREYLISQKQSRSQ